MRAASHARYGGPDVVEVAEVPEPEPGPGATAHAIVDTGRKGGSVILRVVPAGVVPAGVVS